MTCLVRSGFLIADEVDGCSAVTTRKRVSGSSFLKNALALFSGERRLTMRGVMIYYVTSVRVRRCAVFTVGLTAVSGAESVIVVGHCWGRG